MISPLFLPYVRQLFNCDTARILQPGGPLLYLFIGWNRSTKHDPHKWIKDGREIDFDYVAERCVGQGRTEAELLVSVQCYRRIYEIGWEEYHYGWGHDH